MIINESVFEQMVNMKTPAVKRAEPVVIIGEEKERADKTDLGEPHFCRQCANLTNLRCREHNFNPVDDLPRNCNEFSARE